MEKNKMKIISGLLILASVIILCILYPVLRNKDNNKNTNTNDTNIVGEQK